MQFSAKLKHLLLFQALLLLPFTALGQDMASKKISLNISGATLGRAFDEIGRKSGLQFVYNEDINDKYPSARVNIADDDISVGDAVALALRGTNLRYVQDGSHVAISERAASPGASGQPPRQQATTGRGSVSGTVRDQRGVPFVGATVVIPGTVTGTSTDQSGKYILSGVPAGSVTVQFSFIGCETLEVTGVNVAPNINTPLDVVMREAASNIDEVVVTAVTYSDASAAGLYARQKSAPQMSDGLSAEQIRKTSDNNVAQVLRRIAGVTLNDGKYITVRGMSERYNNFQLNGQALPSSEPNRRNFAFDVIPSGLIDNVTVSKTFTPDMQGEFTAGLVDVSTLAVPERTFLDIGAGSGMNTNSTGELFMSNKRLKGDWLFGNIKDRKWHVGKAEGGTGVNWLDGSNYEKMTTNAGKMNTWGMRKFAGQPMQSYSITGGHRFKLRDGSAIGVVAALTYRHEETREDILQLKMITRDSIFFPGNHKSYRWKFQTTTGAVANVGWKTDNHAVTLRNMFNNRFEHKNQERYIWKQYEGAPQMELYSQLLRNDLWQTQLDGRHDLFGGRLTAKWNVSYNEIHRTQPDDRLATGGIEYGLAFSPDGIVYPSWQVGGYGNQYANKWGHIMFSRLNESKWNYGADFEAPIDFGGFRQLVKAGFLLTRRDGDFINTYLTAQNRPGSPYDQPNRRLPLEEIYAPENFDPETGFLDYVNGSGTDSWYNGYQDIDAVYIMGDFAVLPRMRIIGGVRYEKTDMGVTTREHDRFDQELMQNVYKDSLTTIKRTDWLPAVTGIYSITSTLQARVSYTKTLARPDLRELSRSTYYNVDDRVLEETTPQTKPTLIDNFDARLEWYPSPGEVVSLTYFDKKFHDPVERTIYVDQSSQNFFMTNTMLKSARAKGFELNWRKNFAFALPELANLWFAGNYTWMKANVEYQNDGSLGKPRNRPLQGLVPYSINGSLSWEGDRFGAAINYNRTGRKLIMAAEKLSFDQFERPRDVLDLQLSVRFLRERNLEVKLNASDILDQTIMIYRNSIPWENLPPLPPGETYPEGFDPTDLTGKGLDYNFGDWIMSEFKKGINLSVSVSYKF